MPRSGDGVWRRSFRCCTECGASGPCPERDCFHYEFLDGEGRRDEEEEL